MTDRSTAPDYLAIARQRRTGAGQRRAQTNGHATSKPYAAPPRNRYAAFSQPAAEPAPEPVAAPAARTGRRGRAAEEATSKPASVPATNGVEVQPVSLNEEFARVRSGQQRQQERREGKRFALRKPAHPVRTAILSVFAVIMLVAAAVLGPMVYRGSKAYHEIFQAPVPHNDSPFVAEVNPEGTSVIVSAGVTPTAGAAARDAGVSIPEWNGKDRVTILLLGVDRREDEASRSDTMILVNIDPVAKSAAMLSIPRDLKVVIPGYGVHKINSAYAYGDADKVPGGGPGLTIRTIEANFGITVNYYAQVDFVGFTKIIDTIGGLTIDVPYPIKDDEYPGPGNQYKRIFFQTGWQHMDGEQVLEYARTRHDDGDGRRSARQQQVLLALRDQAVMKNLLTKAPQLIGDLGSAVRTDLQPGQALQLARLGTEIDPAAIVQYSLDAALTEQAIEGQPYFLVANWEKVGTIMTQFMGKEIVPPMSALANSNYKIEIRIEDGTVNPGLGGRVAAVLKANGFTNVSVTDKADSGNYPTSAITTDASNLTTAYLIAQLLGIDLNAINVSDSLALTPSPSPPDGTGVTPSAKGTPVAGASPQIAAVPLFPTPTGAASSTAGREQAPGRLVLVLGDDAPDPANYTSDPYDTGQ